MHGGDTIVPLEGERQPLFETSAKHLEIINCITRGAERTEMFEPKLAKCSLCEHIVANPCVPDSAFSVDGLAQTQPLPVPMTDVVRAKAKVELLAKPNFCRMLRHLVHLKLTTQEVIGFASYKIFEGLYRGVRYEWPWGEQMDIGPNSIEEAFSGRPEVALPAHDGPWDDEPPIFYGRAIAVWLGKAANGAIQNDAHDKWYLKLLYIDLALRTPNFDPSDLD